MRYKGLMYAHLILMITAYHLPDRLYFLNVAIAWILIPIFLYLNKIKDKIVLIWIAFTLNNVIDEMLQNATYKHVSEYIFAILITYLILKRNDIARNTKQRG